MEFVGGTDLKDLAPRRLVAVVAHVVAVVWRGRSQTKDVAENTDDSQQTLHLSFVTAGQTDEETENRSGKVT